jgi:hypothetical protein
MRNQESAKSRIFVFIRIAMLAMLTVAMILSPRASAQLSQYVSFDAPGAGTGANQGTFPSCINQHKSIGGTVIYSGGAAQGFLREPNGAFITVTPPGSSQSFVAAINDSGEVAGSYYGTGATYGFVRNASGDYTSLAIPKAYSTSIAGINDAGVVTGFASATGGTGTIGFVWDSQHGYTLFQAPGSRPGATYALAINERGIVTGFFYDNNGYSHGFVRSASGLFSTFEVSGGTATESVAINIGAQTTGWGNDGEGDTDGFVGNEEGIISLFGVSGSPGNAGSAINDSGVIVGYDFSDGGGNASIERDQAGNVSVLALPFPNSGNQAAGINVFGDVVGSYDDSAGASHGWLGIP